jgi:ribosomal protein S18 acetylase RimI-like enzyme
MGCQSNCGSGKKEQGHVQLRPFTLQDIDRILEIEDHSFEAQAFSKSQFEEIYREHPEAFYVAETSLTLPSPKRLCRKSVHGSTSSPRTDNGTLEINYLAVRPQPVLRLRSGHSGKTVRGEPVEPLRAGGYFQSGEVVGYILGTITGEAGELRSLAVDRHFRNLGVGRRLVEEIFNRFREMGIKTCSLKVRTDNEPAIRLYKKIGFEITKLLESNGEGDVEAYLMKISL